MHLEAKKIPLIEDLLKVKSDAVLSQIENILNKYNNNIRDKPAIYDFVGIISEKEAAQMKLAIEETCELIDENEWK